MSIREDLAHTSQALTSAEAKIVQVLLADYPMSGLGTATRLARRAGVSDPTVVRLVIKLGYDGFPDFQAKLLAEVEAQAAFAAADDGGQAVRPAPARAPRSAISHSVGRQPGADAHAGPRSQSLRRAPRGC